MVSEKSGLVMCDTSAASAPPICTLGVRASHNCVPVMVTVVPPVVGPDAGVMLVMTPGSGVADASDTSPSASPAAAMSATRAVRTGFTGTF